MPLIEAERLRRVYAAFARHHGGDARETQVFADALLRADLRDHTTQGVALLPYLDDLIAGGSMAFGRPFEIVRESVASTVVDGHRGVGIVIGARAMELAVERARRAGIGLTAVRRGGDTGMAANYALQALEHGQIGIAMSTGPVLVAPWGGREARFSTNPLALAVPGDRQPPVVIDMATSAYSMGEVVRAARDRALLGPSAVVDDDGEYGHDPAKIVLDVMQRESQMLGALLPAGPKGFGWLLLVEILCNLLSGERDWSAERPGTPHSRPEFYGMCLIAIDVSHFMDLDEFRTRCDRMVETLTSSAPARGFDAVRLPGQRAAALEERRRAEGVPVRDEEWEMVQALIERLALEA